jgi:hypothetical protein
MVWGPPGIGKSSIVAQAAQSAGIDLIDLRLSQLAPTDLRGLPVPERDASSGGTSRWYPPEFLPREGRGVLFLDELNMAAPSVQGVAQQLILDRKIGSYCLPDGWLVWAAGNRKEDRASVFDMPAPLANRFVHLEVEVGFSAFKAYAISRHVDGRIIAFLSFRTDLLHKLDQTRPAWPSPRSWFMASALLKSRLPIAAAVGEAVAIEFESFSKVYGSLPSLTRILSGEGGDISCPEEVSATYATVIGLAMRASSGAEAANGFRWVFSKLSTEWTRTYIQDVLNAMRAKQKQGELVRAMAGVQEFKTFMDDFKDLVVQE